MLKKVIDTGKITKGKMKDFNYYIQSWDDTLNRWNNRLPVRVTFYEYNKCKVHDYENPKVQKISAKFENFKLNIENNYLDPKYDNQFFNLNDNKFIFDNLNIDKSDKLIMLEQNNNIFNIINELNFLNEIIKNGSNFDSNSGKSKTFFNLFLYNGKEYCFGFLNSKLSLKINPTYHDIHNLNMDVYFNDMKLNFNSIYDDDTKKFSNTTIKETYTNNKIITVKKYDVLVSPNELSFNDLKIKTDDSKIKLTSDNDYYICYDKYNKYKFDYIKINENGLI